MKIIERGNPHPWWVGGQAQCASCGTIVEFEPSDPVREVDAQDARESDSIYTTCPVCGKTLSASRVSVKYFQDRGR